LILAPVGRDAAACAKLTEQVGLMPKICSDVATLIRHLDEGAEVVLLTEEALYGEATASLEAWVLAQPPWSDQPFIVLTNHIEGPRSATFRKGLVSTSLSWSGRSKPFRSRPRS
jgi:hypothetical protein